MQILKIARNAVNNVGTIRDASKIKNVKVLRSLLGPAARGYLMQVGKGTTTTDVPTTYDARFNWQYGSDQPELKRLFQAAKRGQWDADVALDWSIQVDPHDPEHELMPDEALPLLENPTYVKLSKREQQTQRHHLLSWMLSQFLHGEQGALFAACQVTECIGWFDGKLYGSTQVMDEGRHVEVFSRYLTEKLEKRYDINDNLYVVIDALMSESRWDFKFLGMQIMVEGLALGAFGTIRNATREPLLRDLLRYVITDEARHVHYGVVTLESIYRRELSEKERREREDWAFELALLMRNRFLAHEFYEEYYAHTMSRAQWDEEVLRTEFMQSFRSNMFRRIIPNLKRIGLLTERVRPRYAEIGLLDWERGKAAPELTADDLLAA